MVPFPGLPMRLMAVIGTGWQVPFRALRIYAEPHGEPLNLSVDVITWILWHYLEGHRLLTQLTLKRPAAVAEPEMLPFSPTQRQHWRRGRKARGKTMTRSKGAL